MISFLEAWENSHTTGSFQPDESAPSPSTHIRTEATGPKHRNLRTGRPEALASRPLSTAAWSAGLGRSLLSRPQFLLWEGTRLEDTSPVVPIPKALGTAHHCVQCVKERGPRAAFTSQTLTDPRKGHAKKLHSGVRPARPPQSSQCLPM